MASSVLTQIKHELGGGFITPTVCHLFIVNLPEPDSQVKIALASKLGRG